MRNIFPFVLLCLLALSPSLSACRTFDHAHSDPKAEFGPGGIPVDWGSLQQMSNPLSIEARLANAAAQNLNTASELALLLTGLPNGATVIDGIVSVPIKMLANDDDGHNHPFGDGQKNASVGWTGWPAPNLEPPVTLTLAKFSETQGLTETARLLVIEPAIAMIEALEAARPASVKIELSNDTGDVFVMQAELDDVRKVYRGVALLDVDATGVKSISSYPAAVTAAPAWLGVLADQWAWPRVKVRFFSGSTPTDDRYRPVLFRFPSQVVDDAYATLPSDGNIAGGNPIHLPPYDNSQSTTTASELLKTWYDAQPASTKTAEFYPGVGGSGVHHHYTDASGQTSQTATGGVDTYVIKEHAGKTQVLYTCFDARDPHNEAQWGVPSGAGWHSIGHDLHGQSQDNWTFAETILNSFESSGIFAGWGVRTPYPFATDAPYGAKDVVSFRVLRAGEAYTTAKGHFHWYAVDAAQKVCTVIWKHLGCALKSDRELSCN